MAGRARLGQELFVLGVVADADPIASAEEAFVAYDKEESEHARNQAP